MRYLHILFCAPIILLHVPMQNRSTNRYISNAFILIYIGWLAVSWTSAQTKESTKTSADRKKRPNIVLVMADDHGYGDCGFTGHPFVKTPNLDDMARSGLVCRHFHSAAPVCSPSRASVLTGRHPMRSNVPNHGHYMRPDELTIAEVLKSAGYATAQFGKWHIGSVQAESPTSPSGAGFEQWLSGLNYFDVDPYLSHNGKYVHLHGQGTVITMNETIGFLERHHAGDKPMFVVTWFPAPHNPHDEIPVGIENAAKLYDNMDKENAGYYREITLLDQEVGRLRECLRKLHIEENTLVIYCSDNGGLVEKTSGGRAMKGSIYQGGLRVPAIMEWPGRFKSGVIETPMCTTDIYPTLVSIVGAKVEYQPVLDGVDLTPVLDGRQTDRPPMGFWHGHTEGQSTWSDNIIREWMQAQLDGKPDPFPERLLNNVREFPVFGEDAMRGHAAWIEWPWKLHRIQKSAGIPAFELYDLSKDPMERTDLSASHSDRVSKMRSVIELWQKSVLESWAGKDYKPHPTP